MRSRVLRPVIGPIPVIAALDTGLSGWRKGSCSAFRSSNFCCMQPRAGLHQVEPDRHLKRDSIAII